MKWKRALSMALACSMIAGTYIQAAPAAVKAEEANTVLDYQDPWENNRMPDLSPKAGSDVNSTKFTHQEWTGQDYTDANGNDVKGPEVYGINREEASMFASTSVVYDTVDKAVEGARDYKKEASKYVQFLTGKGQDQTDWSLVVLQNQTLAQGDSYRDFYKTEYAPKAADDWKENLTLPCSWTRQGFDFSIYTNTQMPWQSAYDSGSAVWAPYAPVNYNPVGLYRKTFTVDQGLKDADGRIYLSFQGVESAYYVYVNGKEVGYSEDTFSPHSFDVTDYLNENGENLLAVKVHKFCDGTWMEDQDMYYDGGIFRDVYLYSAPLVHIQDYTVVTDLDDAYTNANMNLKVTVANASAEDVSGYKVDVRLYDEANQMFVNGVSMEIGTIDAASGKADGKASAELTKKVLAPKLWSAETPNLYTLVLSLYNDEGSYLGSVSQQLGFREIEFTSTQVDWSGNRTTDDNDYIPIKINGKKLLLKGTNRHDTDPVYGKHVPKETQEEDVKLMKQYNLNAIRTSHYSNDEYLYYLCDKYGLYMMGETNLESHDLMNRGDEQKPFKKLAMDRTVTAFHRLKNRTAIVIWSTGNENYYSGDAWYADYMFYDLIWYFKNNDPTRPVHCESSGEKNGTDMGSNMYPSLDTVWYWTQWKQPYVLCEYGHAMGNAVGNLKEYWDAIRSSDNMLGGFIWDWVDQARLLDLPSNSAYDYYAEDFAHKNLYKEEAKGKYYGYGGDSGEWPNDNSFCVNGLVSPDRDVQPELYEVKYQYQSVWFTASEEEIKNGAVHVYNENNFLNLNQFDVTWSLLEDGKEIGTGKVTDTNIPGGSRGDITVPYAQAMAATKAGAEYYLNLSVSLKEDALWAKAGHEVAYEQFKVPADVKKVLASAAHEVKVDQSGTDAIVVSGTDFSFKIDRTMGMIRDYIYKGEVVLTEGPTPNYWRALTNNDRNDPNFDWGWKDVRVTGVSDVSVRTDEDKQTEIAVTLTSSNGNLGQTMVYTVDGNGAVTVTASVDARWDTGLGWFIRLGTVMKLPKGYENVSWYGNGPVEAMSDRETFARVGLYHTTVSEMFYPYLDTQDTGTVTGVKCFAVENPEKKSGLAIASSEGVEAFALHFDVYDLDAARHPYELTKLDETILTVNHKSMGAGNNSCGPQVLDQYKVSDAVPYTYEYTLVPYTADEKTDVMDVTRPYRTATYASLSKLIRDIDAIGSEPVTGADAEKYQDMADMYELLSAEEKAQVTGARLEKVNEALALAKKLQDDIKDEKRGLYVPISGTANLVQKTDGTALEGYADVAGSDADEKFNRLFSATNSYTIEAVVNPNGFGYGDEYNMIASKGDNCSAFRISEQKLYFFVRDYSDNEWHVVKLELTDEQMNQKLHVAAIYDGAQGTIALYLDGKEALQVEKNVHGVTSSSYPLQIGHCQETGRTSKASIYSMRVYSKALTKEELDQGTVTKDDDSVALWLDIEGMISSELTGLRTYTPSYELAKGDSVWVKAEKVPFYAAQNEAVRYTSGNTSIITVNEDTGMARAVGAGETVITASCGGKSLEIPVTVEKENIKEITGISVSEESVTLEAGDTYQLRPVITPSDAQEQAVYTSLQPEIVSVSASGLVTALAKGEADITIASPSNPAITKTVHITVNERQTEDERKPITAITVTKNAITLEEESSYTIEAKVTPENTTETIRYSSLNQLIASVNAEGVITANAAGETDIILESPSNAAVTAAIHVTVTAKPGKDKPNPDENDPDGQKPSDHNPPVNAGTDPGKTEPEIPGAGTKFKSGILEYKVIKSDAKNGTVSVSKLLNKKKAKIVIPETVAKDGIIFKVTAIEKQVFQKNTKITSVLIGANITKIGAKSFCNCSKLKTVTFKGTKVPKIGIKAFAGVKKNCKIMVSKKLSKKNLKKLKTAMKSAGKKVKYGRTK